MSDDWFAFKFLPEQEYHPEEVQALKDYLRQNITATEAAQSITHMVVTSAAPKNEIPSLHGLLIDALMELPDYTEPLLSLLQAIENLPEPDFTTLEPSKRPYEKLWKGLPQFGHQWYDYGYRSGSWKMDAEKTSGLERDKLRKEHVRRAEVEARLVMASLAGIPIDWGYEVVDDALRKDALLDFEVPAAAEWLGLCAKRFRRGAEEGEKSYVMKDEGMTLERWAAWESRLRELQAQSGVVQRAATKALDAMHRANVWNFTLAG
jgi:hypothetical protein